MKKSKLRQKAGHSVVQNCVYIMKDCLRYHPMAFILSMVIAGLSAASSILNTYIAALIVKGLEEAWALWRMILVTGLLAVGIAFLNVFVPFLNAFYTVQRSYCRQQYILYANRRMMNCDYHVLESPKTQVKINQVTDMLYADDTSRGINAIHNGMQNLMMTLLGVMGCIALLHRLSWWIILFVLLVSVVNTLIGRLDMSYVQKHRDQWAGTDKKLSYMNGKLIEKEYAMDIRTYHCQSWLLNKLEAFIGERLLWFKRVQRHSNGLGALRIGLNLVYDIITVGYVVWLSMEGQILISDFVLYMGLIAQLSGFINRFFNSFNSLITGSNDVELIRDFIESGEEKEGREGLYERIGLQPVTIRFDHVSFRYGPEEKKVISDLNLTINQGEKIALIGANGAGKSTLVKLMCGLYRPTEGEIYINEFPLSEYSSKSIWEICSIVFQDFVLLPFSVAQNVAMAEEHMINRERVRKCIERVGLSERITDPDMRLIKEASEDGTELSGGQVQRLLIARAIYKDAPVFLLDEPTAALDPLAESELYCQYNSLMKNKTAVFVSHRLASTRFCDRILFLKDGIISEQGTHEELMKNDSDYAQMFKVQSQYYKEEQDEAAKDFS